MTVFVRELVDYRQLKRRQRAARKARANARAFTILRPSDVPDPLLRTSQREWIAVAAFAIGLSLALHTGVTLLARYFPHTAARNHEYEQPVQVHLTQPAPPPVEIPPLPLPESKPIAPVPTVRVRMPEKPIAQTPPLPPDPTTADVPPPQTSPLPVRRVVGLNLESTIVGGGGAAFAVGNTRMGQTERVSADPNQVEALAPEFTPARRKIAEPPTYPSSLKAKAIEGDVGLRVDIDSQGQVMQVTVVEPSEYEEFNQAAVAAAKRSVYEPARANGVPVSQSIQFIVRFRVRQ